MPLLLLLLGSALFLGAALFAIEWGLLLIVRQRRP